MNSAEIFPSYARSHPTVDATLAFDADDNQPLKVLIAYDAALAARRAIAIMRRLVAHSPEPVPLAPVLWRFDLLTAQPWRDQSLVEAADSDLIVLSTTYDDALPDSLNTWAAACLAQRNGASMAMLTLFGSEDAWAIWIQDETYLHTIRQSAALENAHARPEPIAAGF